MQYLVNVIAQLVFFMLCCSFTVTAQSQSGGEKVGDDSEPGGDFPRTRIVGLKTSRSMKFGVDLEPPTHCLLQGTTDDCFCFPIYLEQDVTTVSSLLTNVCMTSRLLDTS